MEALHRGERPEDLPAYLPLRERLTINGETAAAIGFRPSLEVRELIDTIHEPEGAGPAVVIEAAPEH